MAARICGVELRRRHDVQISHRLLDYGICRLSVFSGCVALFNPPGSIDAVALRLQPGLAVGEGRGAGQGQGGQGGVAVGGGPEGGGAVRNRRPRVAQEGGAVKGQRSVAVVVAAVGVRRRDADGVVVHGNGGAVGGGQQPTRSGPVQGFAGVHLLELKQRQRLKVPPGRGGHAGGGGGAGKGGGGGSYADRDEGGDEDEASIASSDRDQSWKRAEKQQGQRLIGRVSAQTPPALQPCTLLGGSGHQTHVEKPERSGMEVVTFDPRRTPEDRQKVTGGVLCRGTQTSLLI